MHCGLAISRPCVAAVARAASYGGRRRAFDGQSGSPGRLLPPAVSEASTITNCRNITIPCRKNKNNDLQLFRTLEEIGTTARVLFPPYQQHEIYIPSERSVEHADAKTEFIMSNNAQRSSRGVA
uniref:Uncharacterized protein n=1 Tax=Salix viminalis TaxID=40686 RepID=A0A6N2NLQ8_SALVM